MYVDIFLKILCVWECCVTVLFTFFLLYILSILCVAYLDDKILHVVNKLDTDDEMSYFMRKPVVVFLCVFWKFFRPCFCYRNSNMALLQSLILNCKIVAISAVIQPILLRILSDTLKTGWLMMWLKDGIYISVLKIERH